MKHFITVALLVMCALLQYQVNHMKEQIQYLDEHILELEDRNRHLDRSMELFPTEEIPG